jgi:hypothetical protein
MTTEATQEAASAASAALERQAADWHEEDTMTTEATQEAASAALAALERQAADWHEKHAALGERLAATRAGAASSALAGDGTAKPASAIVRLEEERTIARAALGLLDERLTAARRATELARFADDRAAYHRLGRAIAARYAHIAALWAPIREYEGFDFDLPRLGAGGRLAGLERQREGLRLSLNHHASRLDLDWSDSEDAPGEG